MQIIHKEYILRLATACRGTVYHEPDVDNHLYNYNADARSVYQNLHDNHSHNLSLSTVINTLFLDYLEAEQHRCLSHLANLKQQLQDMDIDTLINELFEYDIARYLKSKENTDITEFMFLHLVNVILSGELNTRIKLDVACQYATQQLNYDFVMSILHTIEYKVLQKGFKNKSHLLYALEDSLSDAFKHYVLLEVNLMVNSMSTDPNFSKKITSKISECITCLAELNSAAHSNFEYRIIRQYFNKSILFMRDLKDSYLIIRDCQQLDVFHSAYLLMQEAQNAVNLRGDRIQGRMETIKLLKCKILYTVIDMYKSNGHPLCIDQLLHRINNIISILDLYSGKQLRKLLTMLIASEKAYADTLFMQPEEIRRDLFVYFEMIKDASGDKPIYDRAPIDRAYIRKHDQELLEYVGGLVSQLLPKGAERSISPRDVSAVVDGDCEIENEVSIQRPTSRLSLG